MKTDPTDGKPGLRIESAASVILRDTIGQHAQIFAHVMLSDTIASRSVIAAYVDGLAGAMALAIAGGRGSREEVLSSTISSLQNAVERDLRHLRKK